MSRPFGIAGVQLEVVPWDADATVTKMEEITIQIRKTFPWVKMVLFHELVVPGLVQLVGTQNIDTWKEAAESIPGGPLTERLAKLAKKTKLWLIPGSQYEKSGDKYYNTSIVLNPKGEIVTTYRKMFPWLPYEDNIEAGKDFCVFDVPDYGRFGLSICYDMWFPEMIRTLTWMGAEVILHPTMTPTSDRDLEVVLSQANAIFNQCYFIDINGVGTYGGGQSMIVDPNGRILQKAGTNQTVLTEILDFDLVKRTREYGTLGLSQHLKQWRDTDIEIPLYSNGWRKGELFQSLDKMVWHKSIDQ